MKNFNNKDIDEDSLKLYRKNYIRQGIFIFITCLSFLLGLGICFNPVLKFIIGEQVEKIQSTLKRADIHLNDLKSRVALISSIMTTDESILSYCDNGVFSTSDKQKITNFRDVFFNFIMPNGIDFIQAIRNDGSLLFTIDTLGRESEEKNDRNKNFNRRFLKFKHLITNRRFKNLSNLSITAPSS